MHFPDKCVQTMLWDMKEHSAEDGKVVYLIPTTAGLFTRITGEWVENNRDKGMYFLCHKWENGVVKR